MVTPLCLNLQALCYEKAPGSLQLLRLGNAVFSRDSILRAKVFYSNHWHVVPRTNLTKLEADLANQQFNFVEIVAPQNAEDAVHMRLSLSPTDPAWADTRKSTCRSPREEAFRISVESHQVRVARLGIKNYPTALDCRISFASGTTSDLAFGQLAALIGEASLTVRVLGVADIVPCNPKWVGPSVLNELENSLGGIDQNVNRLDRLHDLMIWPADLGGAFLEQLGEDLCMVWRTAGANPLLIIGLSRDRRWREEATKRVRDFVAPRAPSAERTEPRPSNYPIYSKHEYEELDQRGVIPRLGADEVLHPILDPGTGKVLGIDESEMLVLPMNRALARLIEKQLADACQDSRTTPEERLICYEQIYKRYLNTEYARRIFQRLREEKKET